MMSDIVISYARKDEKLREMLARCLQNRTDFAVWSDDRIQPGEEFSDAINRAIREAKVVIVIWTPESVNSKWVIAEALKARDLGKLMPVRIATDGGPSGFEIPVPFNGIQTLDLTGWDGKADSPALIKLIISIQIIIEERSNSDLQTEIHPPLSNDTPAKKPGTGRVCRDDEEQIFSRAVTLLHKAIEQVPVLRYALGVAGLAAVVSTVLFSLGLDATTALVGIAVVLAFMVMLMVLAPLAKSTEKLKTSKALWLLAVLVCWAYVVIVILWTGLLSTAFFLDWPRSIACLFDSIKCPLELARECNPAKALAQPETRDARKNADAYLATGMYAEALADYKKALAGLVAACPDNLLMAGQTGEDTARKLELARDLEGAARAFQKLFKKVEGQRVEGPPPPDRLSQITVNGTLVKPGTSIIVPPSGSIGGVLEPLESEARTIVAEISSGDVLQRFEENSSGGEWVLDNVHFRPPGKSVAASHVELFVARAEAGAETAAGAVFSFQVNVARPRILTSAVCRGTANCPATVILGTVENVIDQDEKLLIKVGRSTSGVARESAYCLLAEVTGNDWRTSPIPHTDQGNVRVRLREAGLISKSASWVDCSQPFESVLIN